MNTGDSPRTEYSITAKNERDLGETVHMIIDRRMKKYLQDICAMNDNSVDVMGSYKGFYDIVKGLTFIWKGDVYKRLIEFDEWVQGVTRYSRTLKFAIMGSQ